MEEGTDGEECSGELDPLLALSFQDAMLAFDYFGLHGSMSG